MMELLSDEKRGTQPVEGIDRIKRHIMAEADRSVRDIEDDARRFCNRERANAERSCKQILIEARERAEHDANLLVKRGESVADAERRKRDLASKQAIASEVIDRAIESFASDPAEDRIRRYASWIKALGLKEGVITLSEHEKDEIGAGLLRALPGGEFSIDDQAGSFSGGVIVAHGRMKDNLTYDLMVRDHRADLSRIAFELLELDDIAEVSDD